MVRVNTVDNVSGTVIHVGNNDSIKSSPVAPAMSSLLLRSPLMDTKISKAMSVVHANNEDKEAVFEHLHKHHTIKVTHFIQNSDQLKEFASDLQSACAWVTENIVSHPNITCTYVVVGDMSLATTAEEIKVVVKAMQNIHASLSKLGHANDTTKVVTTMVGISNFSTHYTVKSKPSKYQFKFGNLVGEVLQFLKANGFPLVLKIMPYDIMQDENKNNTTSNVVDIKHYLFGEDVSECYMKDDDGTKYKFVFDAVIDSFDAAIKGLGDYASVKILAGTGWCEAEHAKEFTTKLMEHVYYGTPKRPGFLDTFIVHEEKTVKHVGTLITMQP